MEGRFVICKWTEMRGINARERDGTHVAVVSGRLVVVSGWERHHGSWTEKVYGSTLGNGERTVGADGPGKSSRTPGRG